MSDFMKKILVIVFTLAVLYAISSGFVWLVLWGIEQPFNFRYSVVLWVAFVLSSDWEELWSKL